jgi:membrane-associated phospholipid phosphatase
VLLLGAALALVNVAMMDAGIAAWDAKYTYWSIRPSEADPAITTPIGLPNFPSYVSGHAAFSGAAAEVLGYAFPAERAQLTAQADEAAMSRLYAGIHYRFDSEVGLRVGRAVGALAVAQEQARGGRAFALRPTPGAAPPGR